MYLASFYYYCTYPPANAVVFDSPENKSAGVFILKGELHKIDPLHVNLKRIILTGYPFKINKRRAVIRYMFFNPKDIRYFMPIEVRTNLGSRGQIEETLGTHGHMKVLFNNVIKQHDTIMMYLYKAIFPKNLNLSALGLQQQQQLSIVAAAM